MNWLVLSYSFPSQKKSSHRVALWRRLQRVGAISPKAGLYVLPDNEESLESFQWLAQEVQQVRGEALVLRVQKFEGLDDLELIESFRQARKKDYESILVEILSIKKTFSSKKERLRLTQLEEEIQKLRRKLAEISAIDFFQSEISNKVASQLSDLEMLLNPVRTDSARSIPSLSIQDYKNKRWVTRPRPHVDRLACVWLIRRFIDEGAVIHYRNHMEDGEIAFDMKGVPLGHQGDLCSFETIIKAFRLDDPALLPIAEIVHEIDIRDGRYHQPETEGVAAILKGWLLGGLGDSQLETNGIALFESLYQGFKRKSDANKQKI